ncbi:MAG: YggS family pyridoxal phosphate-dependent enzyme [Clostridia bacterium]|nr:YggS family pyridoxal phosphate-dependent enzyme [Clostridia bacterium]
MEGFDYIKTNLRQLKEEISELAVRHGEEVTLVAVTKSGTDEELLALASLGITDIGENRPQELRRRGELLALSGLTPNLHEIGNLQKNKVRLIIDRVSLIHSLDSLSLAEEIDRRAKGANRCVPVLIEINSAAEANKGGILPSEAEGFLKELRRFSGISVRGLMTMGPVCDNPEDIRPYFRLTAGLYKELKSKYGFAGPGVLSMGMSDSYRVAIEEGSTLVRVGRRLFEKGKEK